MNSFVRIVKRVCFIGKNDCNQGGNEYPSEDIINGVVNNGIQVVHEGINVVYNGV